MEKEEALALVAKHVNVPGLLAEVLNKVAEPAVEKLVTSTKNPFDDMAFKTLWPELEEVVNDQVEKLFTKLLGTDEA